MTTSNTVIAIDGPAASGKSTVARRVASALGYLYVDSGALYRSVTWWLLRQGIPASDTARVLEALPRLEVEFRIGDGTVKYLVGGEDPGVEIREPAINENVSLMAAMPEVRARVTAWLQRMRGLGHLVMEGRDIGTAVFPDSPHKFYLDADPAERARRRHLEVVAAQRGTTVQDIGASIQKRDTLDSGRKTAPLRLAPGAAVVDSTRMTIEEVVRFILDCVR